MRDLQTTVLHLLGLDPFQLAYPHLGLKQRPIGPDDEVAHLCEGILA